MLHDEIEAAVAKHRVDEIGAARRTHQVALVASSCHRPCATSITIRSFIRLLSFTNYRLIVFDHAITALRKTDVSVSLHAYMYV
jgi:hypothetical protein